MQISDVEIEIEKLKMKQNEITSKIHLTNDFNEKDNLEKALSQINRQIKLLEKFKGR